jgi:hypothetical protein
MANDTARNADDEEDLERAQQAGELVKVISQFGDEMLVKSELPEDLVPYLTDPLDLMTEMASLGTEFVEDARDIADNLLAADPEAIPEDLAKMFPLVFEDPVQKAFPPKRPPAAQSGRNQGDQAIPTTIDRGRRRRSGGCWGLLGPARACWRHLRRH